MRKFHKLSFAGKNSLVFFKYHRYIISKNGEEINRMEVWEMIFTESA